MASTFKGELITAVGNVCHEGLEPRNNLGGPTALHIALDDPIRELLQILFVAAATAHPCPEQADGLNDIPEHMRPTPELLAGDGATHQVQVQLPGSNLKHVWKHV